MLATQFDLQNIYFKQQAHDREGLRRPSKERYISPRSRKFIYSTHVLDSFKNLSQNCGIPFQKEYEPARKPTNLRWKQ